MAFGLDYSDRVQPSVAKAMGATFVARYVGYFSGYDMNVIAQPQKKCLYPDEAKELMDLGIGVVSVYEWYGARPSLYNAGTATASYAAGAWDAVTANTIHLACGGPTQAPIYFTVDYDSAGIETVDYFKGVASVLGLQRVGVYGGYYCVKFLLDNSLVKWAWQTYAWSGQLFDNRSNIYQYNNGVTLPDGSNGDYNDSTTPRYGNWLEYTKGTPMFTNERCVAVWNSTGMGSDDAKRQWGITLFWRDQWENHRNYMGAPTSHEYPFPTTDDPHAVARNFGSFTVAWIKGTASIVN